MTQKKQVLCDLQVLFSIYNCQTPAQEIVRGEIENGKGTQFDPQIADIMLVLIDEDKEYVMHE